jgi:Galactose-3-O-sulfotransferase
MKVGREGQSQGAGELLGEPSSDPAAAGEHPRTLTAGAVAGCGAVGPVVFVHIPKTAGTTVSTALELLHGERYRAGGNFFSDPIGCRQIARSLREDTNADVVRGHIPFALRPLFPSTARFVTFLRDPVERTVSHYHYHRLSAGWIKRYGDNMTLDEFLAITGHLTDNLQTRMLSGFEVDAPASEDMLAQAKQNLKKFDVVGIVEEFDKSVALLHLTYGWRLLLVPNVRVNASRPPVSALSAEERNAVRRKNELDEELYAEGRRLFDCAVGQLGDRLSIEADALARARELLVGEVMAPAGDSLRSLLVNERAHSIIAESRFAVLERSLERTIRRVNPLLAKARKQSARATKNTERLATEAARLEDALARGGEHVASARSRATQLVRRAAELAAVFGKLEESLARIEEMWPPTDRIPDFPVRRDQGCRPADRRRH